MIHLAICATKGGVGKTTLAANLGAIIADNNYRVLMVDADPQPSLSGFFPLKNISNSTGLTQLLTTSITPVPVATVVERLDIIRSDDPLEILEQQLLHVPDGRLRPRQALQRIVGYDYVIVDTHGASGILLENAILASEICLSPLPPEALAAQEFIRGTMCIVENLQTYSALGVPPGKLHMLFFRFDATSDAKSIHEELLNELNDSGVTFLKTTVPNRVVYRQSATYQIPVHRLETRRTGGISAATTMETLMGEIQQSIQ